MSAPQVMERSDRVEENNNDKNDMFEGQVEEDGDDAKVEEGASIIVTDDEEWLCVAKLPLDTTQEEFTELLAQFGPVKRTILIRSRKTGKLKYF